MREALIHLGLHMFLVLGIYGDHVHVPKPPDVHVPAPFRDCLKRVLRLNMTDISKLPGEHNLHKLYECFSRAIGPRTSSPPSAPPTSPGPTALPRKTLLIIMICMAALIAMLIGVLSTVCFFACCKKKTRRGQVAEMDGTQL
ncbi:uncharacterized protein LOC124149980 [Haliotis rufescens]|uniref:uncharacterized protein LOC124149980 n=1 Tax=Haliotis rufescens TaxID=6454 RepID=UPI001EAFCAA1|nr:uncharacterized protein LOC124149980 [Haliotis rufescens]